MTKLNLDTAVMALGGPDALDRGEVTIEYLTSTHPYVLVDGDQVVLPEMIVVPIVDGAPIVDIDLVPTAGLCYVRIVITATRTGAQLRRNVEIPDLDDVDYGALPEVNPDTYQPTDDTLAAWELAIAQITVLRNAVDAAAAATALDRAAAGTSAFNAGLSAAAAQGSEDAAAAAVLEALAHADTAGGHADAAEVQSLLSEGFAQDSAARAGDALAARTDAYGAAADAASSATLAGSRAVDAETARAGSVAARGDAETARTAAQSAKADAEAAALVSQAGQFAGADLGTADLNTITTPGVRRQGTAVGAQIARNYPRDNMTGTLLTWPVGTGLVIHIFIPHGGAGITPLRGYWMRRLASSTWSSWIFYGSNAATQPAGQPGVELTLWDDVNNIARNVLPLGILLGAVDLDLVDAQGDYYQSASGNATLANHYPVAAQSGALQVRRLNSSVLIQRFTPAAPVLTDTSRVTFERTKSSSGWQPWRAYPSFEIDQTAGRAVYMQDYLNNRRQLVYGDTGWRELALENGWAGSVRVRRVGAMVEVIAGSLVSGSAISVTTLGTGFRPQRAVPLLARPAVLTNPPVYGSLTATSGVLQLATGTAFFADTVQTTFLTTDAWPTVLPGTAVGSIPNG